MMSNEPTPRYSDEWLTWATANAPAIGDRNAAPYLAEIPFDQRQATVHRAREIMNRTAGFNFSGAVWQAVYEAKKVNA